jgi:hypothetical protein
VNITSLLQRAGTMLNPPPLPHDPGPFPQVRDYPIARPRRRSPSHSRRRAGAANRH